MVLLDEIRDWFGNVVVGRGPRRSLRVRPGVVEPLEVRALLATFTVSNLNDAGDGSLRKAISDANSRSGADAIEFMAGIRGTMTLTSGQMTISDSVTITGPGVDSLTISADNTGNRILLIDNANASLINVSISGVTVRDAGDGGATIINGGAISNVENLALTNVDFISNHSGVSGHSGALAHSNGALLITSCRFTDNNAGLGGGGAIGIFSGTATITGSTLSDNVSQNNGGAIRVTGGTVEILQSTISGNTAVSGGGGIVNESTAGVLVQNSTISGNSAGLSGGGVFNDGPLTIRNSTITNNTNDHSGGVYSQNITPQQLIIRNSIIAGNKQTNGTPTDLRGTTPTISNSLVGVNTDTSLLASATPDTNGNLIGSSTAINPQLGPLAFNGGPTQTHALLTGSPAIDRGNNTILNGLTTDQRGNPVARIANSTVDMGAYELFTLANPIVVSTTTDELDGDISSGDLSLREAIVLANSSPGMNTITFAASTNNVEFNLTLGQMEISETVTITGNGSSTTSIDAQQKSRIFTVNSGDVTLNNLTLKNGRVANGPGGAILSISTGTLTISQSTLADNSATGYGHGGGAIMTLTGAVTINRSTLSGNATGGVTAEGGAIKSESGAVTISNSTLSGNRTTNSDSNGGAVYANSGSITISQSTLSDNFTAQTLAHGGAVCGNTGNIVISQSTLTLNAATNSNGGAIFSFSSPLTIRNSIVAGNTDAGTAADVRKSPDGGDAFTVTNSLIGRNNGTGLTPTSGSTPDANGNFIGGNNAGAAINPQLAPLAKNGGPTQTHALLTGSPAINRGNNSLLNGLTTDQRGTPMARITDTTVDMGAYELFTLANPIIVSTTTDELDGNISSGSLSLREAIVLANSSPGMNTITFAASTNNSEFDLTLGQMEISETVTITGNGSSTTIIDAQQKSRIFDITGTADVTLTSLRLKNGRTTGNNVDFTDTTFSGGAVRSLSSGTLTISQSIISGNSTTGINAYGGGIFAYSGAVTLTNSTVSGNSTTGRNARGGGIFAYSGEVRLSGSTVSGNTTAGDYAYGGGIFAISGAVTLTNSTISGNSTAGSSAHGGGIYARSGAVTLTGSTISGNTTAESSADGGGIFTIHGAVTLTSSTVSGNSTVGSSADGGGIFAYSGAVTLNNSTVLGNSTVGSTAHGGGIFASSGTVTLNNSTASGNSTAGSTAHGGGIFASSGAVTLTHSTVSGNSTAGSTAHGGGIYSLSGAVTLTNSTVSGNQVSGTDSDGGGVWLDDSVVIIVNSTLTGNSANRAGGGLGVFVNATDKKLTIHNSIIAGNTAASNPDFRAPTNPTTNLEVRHSLIGRSNGTTLTATLGTTPDVNGNLIGGPTDGTKINPLLAPLANNGGPTQTHALLNNSPAFNRGNDTLAVNVTLPVSPPLNTDQRGASNARNLFGIVDMGALESSVLDSPEGTTGNDAFTLAYSSTATTGTVTVTLSTNSGPVVNLGTFPMNSPLTINGLGGTDSVRIVGTSGADSILVNNSMGLTFNGASLILTSIENRTLAGAAGSDVYRFDVDTALGLWTLDESGGGTDTVDFSPTSSVGLVLNLATAGTQAVHATNLSLILGSAATIENATGGAGADTLFGNGMSNTLGGGAGNDQLIGAGGNDVLLGGADNDTYIFVPATVAEADTVSENLNQGSDTLSFAFLTTSIVVNLGSTSVQPVHANRTLKLNSPVVFENIIGGSGADTLFGNTLNNTLTGNAGNDKLLGAGGNDVMRGGANNDTYMFVPTSTAEADQVIENVNEGSDTLNFAYLTTSVVLNLGSTSIQPVHANRTLRLNSVSTFENAVSGTGSDTLLGNAVANRLTGGLGDNILVGLEGGDILEAGNGRDILIGGLGLDILKGDAGDDILIAGRTTSDTSLSNLSTLRTQWISGNAYATRITNLRAGVGSPLVSLKTTINVLNDAGEDDVLFGGTNTDWFFRAVDDVIADLFAGELIDVL